MNRDVLFFGLRSRGETCQVQVEGNFIPRRKIYSLTHHVVTAYQRTGFILNENGAVVESEAFAVTDSSDAEPVKILPKRMVFDKPFFVMLKRTKSDYPYFVMYVQNSELLTKK